MPQLLYHLHNSPVVVPLKFFQVVDSIFQSLLWKGECASIKLKQLQKPKDGRVGLTKPLALLYSIPTITSGGWTSEVTGIRGWRWRLWVLMQFSKAKTQAEALETHLFFKIQWTISNIQAYSKNLAENQATAEGYIGYSPSWNYHICPELAKVQHTGRWRAYRVTHIRHIMENGQLQSFAQLQAWFSVPSKYALLLSTTETSDECPEFLNAKLSPTPIFAFLQQSYSTKGFISNCYAMLIGESLESFSSSACEKWMWGLSLVTNGRRHWRLCECAPQCFAEVIEIIYLIEDSSYSVQTALNRLYQVSITPDPRQCILSIIDAVIPNVYAREAATRALFQVHTGAVDFPHTLHTPHTTAVAWANGLYSSISTVVALLNLRGYGEGGCEILGWPQQTWY